jgi:hypothetical protein
MRLLEHFTPIQTEINTFIHAKAPPSALLTDVRCLVAMFGSDATLDRTSQLNTIPRDFVHLLNHTMTTRLSAIPTLHNYASLLPFTQSMILIQILTLFIIPPRFNTANCSSAHRAGSGKQLQLLYPRHCQNTKHMP